MPDLDQLFRTVPQGGRLDAFSNAHVWEAQVRQINNRGVYVIVPSYDRHLMWGPIFPGRPTEYTRVGDVVGVALSDQGRPWMVSHGLDELRRYVQAHVLDPMWPRIAALEGRVAALEARP